MDSKAVYEEALAAALAGTNMSAGMSGFTGGMGLAEGPEAAVVFEPRSEEEAKAVEELVKIQDEYEAKQMEEGEEIKQVQRKFVAQYDAVLQKRTDVVKAGKVEDFWLRTLCNCPTVADNITEKDEDVLKYLTSIRKRNDALDSTPENPLGSGSFTLFFDFEKNPYFKNETLSKSYIMDGEQWSETLSGVKGTKIDWKEGKNVTVKVVRKTIKGKGKNNSRTVNKLEPCDSFFNFFQPPETPEPGTIDPELEAQISDLLDADFEVGDLIGSELVPNAIRWFLGEAKEEDSEEDEEPDDYMDGDDDYDDEDSDEYGDDDDFDDQGPRGKKTTNKMPPNGPLLDPATAPEECKQQ